MSTDEDQPHHVDANHLIEDTAQAVAYTGHKTLESGRLRLRIAVTARLVVVSPLARLTVALRTGLIVSALALEATELTICLLGTCLVKTALAGLTVALGTGLVKATLALETAGLTISLLRAGLVKATLALETAGLTVALRTGLIKATLGRLAVLVKVGLILSVEGLVALLIGVNFCPVLLRPLILRPLRTFLSRSLVTEGRSTRLIGH